MRYNIINEKMHIMIHAEHSINRKIKNKTNTENIRDDYGQTEEHTIHNLAH